MFALVSFVGAVFVLAYDIAQLSYPATTGMRDGEGRMRATSPEETYVDHV